MGSSVIFDPLRLSALSIEDANHSLSPRVDVEVADFDRLLMTPPMPAECLDEVQFQSKELVGVRAVGADVFLRHAVLALSQKPKSREPRRDDLQRNEAF